MNDDLIRPIRTAAAWVMVTFVALLEAVSLYNWLDRVGEFGVLNASVLAGFGSLYIIALPILAVVLTGMANPPTRGASKIAVIAFAQYGIALLFGVLTLATQILQFGDVIPAEPSYLHAPVRLDGLAYAAGDVALICVATFAVWRILSGLTPMPAEDIYEEEDSPA